MVVPAATAQAKDGVDDDDDNTEVEFVPQGDGQGAADARSLSKSSGGRSAPKPRNKNGSSTNKMDFGAVLGSLTAVASTVAQALVAAGPATPAAIALNHANAAGAAPLPTPLVQVTPAGAAAGAYQITGLNGCVELSEDNLMRSLESSDITVPSFFFDTCNLTSESIAPKFGLTVGEAETLTGLQDLASVLIDVLREMRQNGGDFLMRLNGRYSGVFTVMEAKKIERVLLGLLNAA